MKTFSLYHKSALCSVLATVMAVLLNGFTLNVTAQTPLVGSLGGAVAVSPDGMASYSIPIEVVPGTKGVQPSLSVVYSSAGGRGVLGSCWTLAGLSSVSRIPRSHFHDGDAGAVNFDALDRYALDGARLVRLSNSNVYAATGAVYGKEAEDFTRVTLNGAPDTQAQYFTAVTADGTLVEYGNSRDSKQALDGKTLSWWVDRVTDPDRNYMTVEYTGSDGELVPLRIQYTYNTDAGLSAYAKVLFEYTADPNPNKMWVGGKSLTSSRLLSGVKVYYRSTLVRSYSFEYAFDRSTRLTAVVLKDGAGAELTRTSVAWGNDGTAAESCELDGMQGRHICAGDFDGDNRSDLFLYHYDISKDSTLWTVMKGDGSGGFTTSLWSGALKGDLAFSALDSDCNGTDEVGFACPDGNGSHVAYKALRFSVSGTTVHTLATTAHPRIIPCDFLGKGGAQFLFVSAPENQHVTVSNNVNGATLQIPSQARLSLTDLNGNGKADLQVVFGNNIDVYEYDAASGAFLDILSPAAWQTRDPVAEWFGDVNGDGNRDYIYFSNDSVFLRVSKGNDYAPSQALPLTGYTDGYGTPLRPLMVGDVNGDGKDDILQPKTGGGVTVCMSRGIPGGVYCCDIMNHTSPGPFTYSQHEYEFDDFNGDGKSELVYKRSTATKPVFLSFPERRGHDLVSAFTDGFGKTVSLRYGFYNTPNVHCLGTDGRRVRWPLAMRVLEPDGAGGTSVTYHTYGEAVYDTVRKQALGFLHHLAYRDGMNALETFHHDGNRHRLVPEQSLACHWERDTAAMGGYVADGEFWDPGRAAFYHHETTHTPEALSLDYGRFVPYNAVTSVVNRLENTKTQTWTWLRNDGLVERVSTIRGNYASQNGVPPAWAERDSTVFSYTTVTVPNGSAARKLSGQVTRHRRNGFSQTPKTVTSYYYSAAGRLDSVSVSDLDGRVGAKAYTYNIYGLPVTETLLTPGMTPAVTAYTYTGNGRFLFRETGPLGHTRSFEHDTLTGLAVSETDANGLATAYRYDALGRVTRVTRPDGTSRAFSYEWNTDTEYPDAVWRVRETETGTPGTVEWRDILGRAVHSHTEGRGYHDAVYDRLGRMTAATFTPYATPSVVNPQKTWRRLSYDCYGRVLSEKDPFTSLSYTYYDPELNPQDDFFVTVTDSLRGTQRTRRLDALGRLKRAEDAGGSVVYSYGYATRSGRILDSMAVATGGALTAVLSDTRGNRLVIQDPDAGTVTSDYDRMDRLVSRTDANGNTAAYTYDLLGRVLTATFSDGVTTETVGYTYDNAPGKGAGQLAAVTHDGLTERSYRYDSLGRVAVMDIADGGAHYIHSYAYDALGRLQYLTYPSGYRTRRLYNSYGELASVVDAEDRTLVYSVETRDVFRHPLKCRFGNGTGTQYSYNAYGMLTGISNGDVTDNSNVEVLPPDPAEESVYSIGSQYRQLVYTHNPRGFISSREDLNTLQSEAYTYDNLDRLVSYRVNGAVADSLVYDGTGNIESSTRVGHYTYGGDGPHAVTRVRGGAGSPIPSSTCDVAYGLRNLPTQISENGHSVTVDYDAEGMRRHTRFYQGSTLLKTVTRVSGLHEVETAGGVTRQLDYIHAGDDIVAVHVRNGSADSLYYVLADHLGSWEKVMDGGGNTVQQTHFDPWGNRMSYTAWNTSQPQNAFLFSRGFTGHEHYDRFKIINANARLYDPVIGRFFSPDPFVQVPDFTQSFNRYSYCMNNPVMYSDPDGKNPLLIAAAVYFIFFTNPGYEIQKYTSPVALNIDIRLGTHQRGIGFNISYGMNKDLPYSKRWEQGSSYYWKSYGGYRGYEHRKGSEQTVLGFYHWGKTHFEAGEFTQTVGKRSWGIPSMLGVDVSNDLWGDGGDRFRTSHQRINFFPYYIGGSVFTGDPGMENMQTEEELEAASGYYYVPGPNGDPDKYRHGILYKGMGPIAIGWDSENIRHILQNIIGHNWISPRTPWFKIIPYDPMFYFQFGWGDLW